MTTTFARMRQILGSTAEWAADDLVLGAGEIAIELSGLDVKMKIGDGAKKFSTLPYFAGVPTTIPPVVQAALNLKMNTSGGTLTGALTLIDQTTGTVSQKDAVSRQWVEANIKPVWATAGEVIAGTVNDHAVTPQTVYAAGVSTGGTAAQAGKFARLNGQGKVDQSMLDGVTTSSGAASAGKVAILNSSGKISTNMLDIPGVMTVKGTKDFLTDAAPASPAIGDVYISTGPDATTHPSWGVTHSISKGDAIFWNGTAWDLLEDLATIDLTHFLHTDGTNGMTAELPLFGNAVNALGAVPKQQLDAAIAAEHNNTLVNFSTITATDGKINALHTAVRSEFTTPAQVDAKVTTGNAAERAWVVAQNYLNTAALAAAGYATEAWVTAKGFTTQTWVSAQGYTTQAWVTAQGFATQAWVNAKNFLTRADTSATGAAAKIPMGTAGGKLDPSWIPAPAVGTFVPGQLFASVSFDGIAGGTIYTQHNVSSVTRVGSGRYHITFTTPAPSAGYFFMGMCGGSSRADVCRIPDTPNTQATGFDVEVVWPGHNAIDGKIINVIVYP